MIEKIESGDRLAPCMQTLVRLGHKLKVQEICNRQFDDLSDQLLVHNTLASINVPIPQTIKNISF